MSLIDDLQTLANNPFADDDGPWRTYVIDHIPAIQKASRTAYLDQTYIDKFRYDITWFMIDQGIDVGMTWIFRLINDLDSDFSFRKPGMYYLPQLDNIDRLHAQWQASNITRNA